MRRGAAYIRVSTQEQLEYSPQSQRVQIQAYAEAHQITLLSQYIYLDEGVSGRTDRRPAFQQMLLDARQKPRPFDVLLVWEFSRFARNRADSILYKSLLRNNCGIEVRSVKEPLSSDPTAVLVEALLEAMDEYYSLNLGQEVRRGMNEKFYQGGVVTIAPFGYLIRQGRMIPDPVTAPWVPRLFQQYLMGNTLAELAAWLNDAGLRTVRGNRFEGRSVRYILSNPVYLGKARRRVQPSSSLTDRYYQGADTVIVDAQHPALVSDACFEQVQTLLSRHSTGPRRTKQKPYALRGLVYCVECGCPLSRTNRTLQCSGYARGRCISHGIALSRLTAAVVAQMKLDLPDLPLTCICGSTDNSLNSQVQALQSRLRRLRQAYEAGIEPLDSYGRERQRLQTQLDALQVRGNAAFTLQTSVHQVLDLCREGGFPEELQHQILAALLERVTLSRPGNEVELTYRCSPP